MFYTRDYKLLGKDLRGVGSLTFMFIHHTLGEAWLIPQGFSPILSFSPNCDGYGSLGEKNSPKNREKFFYPAVFQPIPLECGHLPGLRNQRAQLSASSALQTCCWDR